MDEIINLENEDINTNDIEYEDDTSSEEDILLFKNISYKEQDEIIETIHELTEEFVKKDISQFSNPHILDIITNEITAILMDTFINADICKGSDIDQIKLADFVESNIIEWFQQNEICYPLRQEEHMNYNVYTMVFGQEEEYIKPIIQQIISDLQEKNRKIPAQRTPEWYISRHNMITASNLYQIFGSPALQNRLVYEKCQPISQPTTEPTYINTELSTHWGVKYEPVSTSLYEEWTKTKVDAFGCLTHNKYPFIGASPDGIITDPKSPYFGRMLEIKNIVNREIDGIPSEAYWIQMQIQMEVCQLETCDFLETRFKEYESEDAFYAADEENMGKRKGVILYFVKRGEQIPYYQYMPLSISTTNKETVDQWIQDQKEFKSNQEIPQILFKTIYWYLDEYSLITVRKNDYWFQSVIPQITAFWELIMKERVEGFEHRAPKSRSRTISDNDMKTAVQVIKIE